MNLLVRHYFDAAHQLTDCEDLESKACARTHGHTYAVKVMITAEKLNKAGMVVDFKRVKGKIDQLDHQVINDIFEQLGYDFEPTAENTAIFIAREIEKLGVEVAEVHVCEGYKGEERASWAIYYPYEDDDLDGDTIECMKKN